MQDTGWSLVELEGSSARDGQSRVERLREEIRFVTLDLKDHPGHPRLQYYAGALRYELASELQALGSSAEGDQGVLKLAQKAAKLLARRARHFEGRGESPSQEHAQQTSAAAFYCGRAHTDFLGDPRRAEKWYREAIKLEADFLYAHVALIHLLFKDGRYQDALSVALQAEAAAASGPGGRPRARLFMDSGPLQLCDVPLLISKALYYAYLSPQLRHLLLRGSGSQDGSPKVKTHSAISGAWRRREALLEGARQECPRAASDTADKKLSDIGQLQKFWKSEGFG